MDEGLTFLLHKEIIIICVNIQFIFSNVQLLLLFNEDKYSEEKLFLMRFCNEYTRIRATVFWHYDWVWLYFIHLNNRHNVKRLSDFDNARHTYKTWMIYWSTTFILLLRQTAVNKYKWSENSAQLSQSCVLWQLWKPGNKISHREKYQTPT